MKQWASGDPVSSANLNSTFEADAYVVAGASPNGNIYATIQAAINAGRKNILVAPGEHTAFSLPASALGTGVRIRGERPATINPSAGVCARIVGQVTIDGDHNTLEQLAWKSEASHSVVVQGAASHNLIMRCTAYACGTGFRYRSNGVGNRYTASRIEGCANGMIVSASGTGAFTYSTIDHNEILNSEGHGILVSGFGVDDITVGRNIVLAYNHIDRASQEWSSSGIRIEDRAGAVIVGNRIRNCGTSSIYSDGILVDAPAAFTRTLVIGNFCVGNYGVGIRTSGPTSQVVVSGNSSSQNSVGQYANLSSSPGYATGSFGTNA